VVLLGVVSLLNDAASEMIVPLLPVFLTASLGAGPAAVGLVEGVAEATASVLKLVSGRLADRGWSPKGLTAAGYGLSNSARPLIGLALGWVWVLALRFVDRVGKGLRTSPRDALISAAVPGGMRGRAFGLHRAMDHAGAVLGPLAAFWLLQQGADLPAVFLASAIPGLLAVSVLLLGLAPTPGAVRAAAPLDWRGLDVRLRGLILAAAGLALGTAPEAFLVLWAQARGLGLAWVPLVWAAAHVGKALAALPAGSLSDRAGRLPVLMGGWALRILVLLCLAYAGDGKALVWALFLSYAAALASTEAAERALVGDFAPAEQRATAFGLYHLASGIMALPGAVLFGLLWQYWGMSQAFVAAALLTGLAAAALLVVASRAPQTSSG
jgi:MFS family permease